MRTYVLEGEVPSARRGPLRPNGGARVLTCYMCGETKPEAEFAFADMAKGTRQRHCRKCQAAYRRAHYVANRHEYIRREVARIKRYRLENRPLMLAYLLEHPCVDCGETNPVMLDFDHRDPAQKRDHVGVIAAHKPWRLVLLEIEKCDVRCANCHQRRTAKQFNWRKIRESPAPLVSVSKSQPYLGIGTLADARESGPATKVCSGCGLPKPIEEFPIKHKTRGTRGTRCRACRSAYGKMHYQRNREAYLARARARRANGGRSSKYWAYLMEYLRTHSCIDCGETDPLVLQFDHRDGTEKLGTVGVLVNRASWATLLAEIEKV
jgi:hypothetical protein